MEYYGKIVEDAPGGIVIFQEEKIVFANRKACELTGYSAGELYEMTALRAFVHEADGEILREGHGRLLRGEKREEHFACRIMDSRGEIKWFSIHGSLISWKESPAVLSFLTDVSLQKKVEDDLRESQNRLADIVDFLPDPTLVIDRGGRVIAWNRAIEDMTGVSADRMVGKGDYEYALPFYGIRRPILLDLVLRYDERVEKEYLFIKREGDILFTETDVPRVKGKSRILWGRARPLRDSQGNIVGAIETIRDVTERKHAEDALRESEVKYRNILESMEEAYFELDLEGNMAFFNESACLISGYGPGELMGLSRKAYTTPETAARMYEAFHQIFLAGQRTKIMDFEIIRKDGEKRILEITASLRKDVNGVPSGFRGVARDVTEKKKSEEERAKLEALLFQAQKMESIGTLAGGIAHDFNNILTSIQGNVSLMLLAEKPSNPNFRRLKSMEDQIVSGSELTRQLLGFAQGGKYEVRPSDLNGIIEKVSSMFERTKKEITIHHDFDKNLWIAETDQSQMEQVLLSLLVNASQAMPSGGDVYLETKNVLLEDGDTRPEGLEAGRYIRISVTDTGMGMDEHTKMRVFDPFFTTKEMGRGIGLGLAAVYGIVKGHRGMIRVYSEKGHGTTFSIYFPASGKHPVPVEETRREHIRGRERILLVDDEEIVLDVTRELLEILGYRVFSFRTGREAVDYYETAWKDIDVVILDMIMPVMSGGETFDALKKINPDVIVILSSGYSMNGKVFDIMNRGVKAFIQKPFRIDELTGKIRMLTGSSTRPA